MTGLTDEQDDKPDPLTALLGAGEHAAFHGKPAAAALPLRSAVALADSQGRVAESCAAAWLLGVALGASGSWGQALQALSPLAARGAAQDAQAEVVLFGSLASSTAASVLRQLGRHDEARHHDLVALELAGASAEARFDAELGLASDAVGLDDIDEAGSRLETARAVLPERDWWRQRVRLGWAEAEVALLVGDAAQAVAVLRAAVDRAEQARAPRHVAKGLLIQGIAELSDAGPQVAAGTLRRAATLAEQLGALPLIWPSRALLGAVLAEDAFADESERSLAAARTAVRAIADDLPGELQTGWLTRPDVVALLAGGPGGG